MQMNNITRIFFALLIATLPTVAAAASFQNPVVFKAIRSVLEAFILGIIYVGTPALAAFIVWTGFLFVAAQGSHEGLAKAKQMAVYVLIGGVLLVGLWGLVRIVGNTLASLSAASLLVILAGVLLYILYKKRS